MLCGILEGFGVTFGASHLLYQGDEYNRDGYFEIKEIRLIYEKLFSEICSSWRSTALLKEEIFEKEKAAVSRLLCRLDRGQRGKVYGRRGKIVGI